MKAALANRLVARTPLEYTEKVSQAVAVLMQHTPLIYERLRFSMGKGDKLARSRAYHDLAKEVRTFLKNVPNPPVESESKPEIRSTAQGAIPFKTQGEKVYMGCFKCPEWIDVTKVFTDQVFDGVYRCPNNDAVIFTGIERRLET